MNKKKSIYLLLILILIFVLVAPGSFSLAANTLFDGGFEQYPDSSWWYHSEPIGSVFMNSTLNNVNFFDSLVMPSPLCGTGIYNVGKTTYPLDWRNGSVPGYQFAWTGGTFFWQAGILGPWFRSFFPITAYSYADIYLLDSQGNRTELLTNYQTAYGADWSRQYGSTNLGAGSYTLFLGRGTSMEKTDAFFYKYQLFYDDVYIGASEPSHTSCQEVFDATPTFEPTQYGGTRTPEATSTWLVTPTLNTGWHWHTFTDSYNSTSGVNCPDGEQMGGAYVDWAFNSNIQVYIDPNRMYAYRYNPPGTTTRFGFQWANGADYLGLDWGSVTQFINFHDPSHDRFTAFDSYNLYGQPGAVACYGALSPSPTPTLSPTPGPSPTQTTKLGNCGFELGEAFWYVTPPSYIALDGGPAGPQNGVAVPNSQSLPNIWQNFYWPVTQLVYIQGWSKGQAQVRIWNIYSNFEYRIVYTGNDADWVHWQQSFTLPMGYYRIELNTFLPAGSEGRFDGITLAANDYLNDAFCSMYTPTPGPTSFVTPTPGPSLTPSRTATLRTSITPWGTMTPWPSITVSITATAGNAQTSTAQASITPGSGGGGGSTQTPGPGDFVPPEQPPGGEGAPCQRPQTWTDSLNLGWWLDYEVCDVKRFLSWGPSANATVEAIPTMFAGKEPFHTIDGIQNGFHGMQTQVATYEWHDTGMDGVARDAETINPRPDKILNNFISPGVSEDPWAIGGTISFNNTPDPDFFSKICSTHLTDILPGSLAQGLCVVLNITRKIGYLGWVSFMLNAMCIFAIIKNFLSIFNFYGKFSLPGGSGSTEVITNIITNEAKK